MSDQTETTPYPVEETITAKDFSDLEVRLAIQLLADRLGFRFSRRHTPDYSILWMAENGTN